MSFLIWNSIEKSKYFCIIFHLHTIQLMDKLKDLYRVQQLSPCNIATSGYGYVITLCHDAMTLYFQQLFRMNFFENTKIAPVASILNWFSQTRYQFQTYSRIIKYHWESLRINFRLIWESSGITKNQRESISDLFKNHQESLRITKNQFQTYLRITNNHQELLRINFRLIQESLRIIKNR